MTFVAMIYVHSFPSFSES